MPTNTFKFGSVFKTHELDEYGDRIEIPNGSVRRRFRMRLAEPDEIQCYVHGQIVRHCRNCIAQEGYYEHKEILADLDMSRMSDAVRWDYIERYIHEYDKIELLAVNTEFFKNTEKLDVLNDLPERFLAGYGRKKTAGYVEINDTYEGLLLEKLANTGRKMGGLATAATETAKIAEREGITHGGVKALAKAGDKSAKFAALADNAKHKP